MRAVSLGSSAVNRKLAELRKPDEMFLSRKTVAVADGTWPRVATVRLEQACLPCVGKIGGEHFIANAFTELRVLDGKQDFDAGIKIALHPIGAAEIEIGIPAIFEIKDAAVFQEAANHAADSDAAADAAQTGNEGTLASND